jgi:hypothetical protein
MSGDRENSVFVNCPFDSAYAPMLDALVFAISACGLKVRSALEVADSGELRLQKILRLLENSGYSIHDLCRIELDPDSSLPRFNMPLELGIALGMKHLGNRKVKGHAILVLDSERYRYVRFASDLAGVDISAHGNTPERIVRVTRDFLATHRPSLPDGNAIYRLYEAFEDALPAIAAAARQTAASLTFVDRLRHVETFLGTLSSE